MNRKYFVPRLLSSQFVAADWSVGQLLTKKKNVCLHLTLKKGPKFISLNLFYLPLGKC